MEENIQEKGCKMPKDLRVGIAMVLTLLEGQAEEDFMTKIIIQIIKEEAISYEDHQDLTKLVGLKSIMMSMYDAFADALALLKDTPCANNITNFKVGEENDDN